MVKVITAVRRPPALSLEAFLDALRDGSVRAAGDPAPDAVVISEVLVQGRGELQADAFVETWWADEADVTASAGDVPAALAQGITRWVTREHVLKRPEISSDPVKRKILGTAYRRDDFTPQEFFTYWWDVHAPLSSKAAGLGGYVVSEVLARIAGTMDADAFVEQWWPDQPTLDAASASDEVATAWVDVANYAKTTGTFWTVREHVVAPPTYEAPGLLEV